MGPRLLWRMSNRVEAASLRYLGTSVVALLARTQVMVLETTGRRTGRTRRTPVAYWQGADGALFIGGGAGGLARVDWVANLRANPAGAVWLPRGRRGVRVVARELAGDDYQAARQEAFARWPRARGYERRSGRKIPFFRLETR